ncbi:error-prone DNA polymerase [Candidatus Poriferisodalis sp.]|uniref:error-prone DNA polymerase n=1 Tax=Candidatus Poriferisodalis sp. TaxID=3101277 RepID=UPI003D0C1ECA
MGFSNPGISWRELERRLSDRPPLPGHGKGVGLNGARGDATPQSTGRPPPEARRLAVPYAELHTHSHFSFLDGASSPSELVDEAVRLGLDALALTDHNGFYGVVRFAEAAARAGLPTVFGTELTLGAYGVDGLTLGAHSVDGLALDMRPRNAKRKQRVHPERTGCADPAGSHVVVLARSPRGYASLGELISTAQMAGRKHAPRLGTDEFLAAVAEHRDEWAILTGHRKGAVCAALAGRGPRAAAAQLDLLIEAAGRQNVFVELWDHGDPLDSERNDALGELAVRAGVEPICTNGVHYAAPAGRRLATAVAAVRARRSLDELDGWLPPAAGAHLRSGAEQARRFARWPSVVAAAAQLGRDCAFDLSLVAPNLAPYRCPGGHDEMSYLRHLVSQGALWRYGSPEAERVPGAWAQIRHELDLIEQLGFAGYFLVVSDIVSFCGSRDIYCQGRGSASNSAVCYALGITNVDSVALGLLFERFLSPERDGPPDIDVDIESRRREEVIQYVYERYGRAHTAQVANVITYRARSAVRDMARALGWEPGQADAWSKSLDRYGSLPETAAAASGTTARPQSARPQERKRARDWRDAGPEPVPDKPSRAEHGHIESSIPDDVLELAVALEGAPRHLGIHSGGMVICDRPVTQVCPTEWATMADRSVLQWDKDDCAAIGLVKFDLLGLGMLSALHYAVDLIADTYGVDVDLGTLPQQDEVYDMLCRADSIGVFQVESRAQMATLPRLRPRCFYDLVVEVALIRPGPIQGGSVHPYIRRRNGTEPVTYLHPLLEKSLAKTLGVPLFQEQLMQMAIDAAGFTPAESDELRQAMGSKRSRERMGRLRERLFRGMAERGLVGDVAERVWDKMVAFADYGFPESHSVSFAHLVYASAWIKLHYPAAFCAALLNAQPMGFYSPHSLCQDARRHGVEVRTPCINASSDVATLEPCPVSGGPVSGGPASTGAVAVRLGLSSVRGLGDDQARQIADAGPFASMEDLCRRTDVGLAALEALATAGAFDCFGLSRREALWSAGAVAQSRPGRLAGIVTGAAAPQLGIASETEIAAADLWATGVSPDGHPTRFLRSELAEAGVRTAAELLSCPAGRVRVAGLVTHRQRPMTAGETTFLSLEDETGLINVVVSRGCWIRYRSVLRDVPALVVSGRLERHDGAVNVIAEKFDELSVAASLASRDFR